MKSKKIVALALTAAMALSISITAFAAKTYQTAPITGSANGSWGKLVVSETDTADNGNMTVTEMAAFVYYVKGERKAPYSYKTGKDSTIADITGGKKTTNKLTDSEKTALQTAAVKATVADLKLGDAKAPDGYVALGWTTVAKADSSYNADLGAAVMTENDFKDTTKAYNVANTSLSDLPNESTNFVPAVRVKTQDEKDADAVAEANAEKVAKSKDGKKQYSAAKIEVQVSAVEGESATAEALKAANAAADKSFVKEIHPVLKADNTQEVVLMDGKTIKVEFDNPFKGNDKAASAKVFHIKNGKSQAVNANVTKDKISFEYGDFSQFVVTIDENAKGDAAPAATSTEATATSTSTSTGTEDAAADGGNVPTGEFSALPIALLAVAALSATGVVAYKKRIAE